ncbi:MAG: hypothetical protein GY865_00215 [candidate division Zixibacteria bacterium]|nr:hypothetical protein [candidate division Zixibacteria bacterium]
MKRMSICIFIFLFNLFAVAASSAVITSISDNNLKSPSLEVNHIDSDQERIVISNLISTFLGGQSNEGNVLSGSMVTDDDGYVYIAGRTSSLDFPTTDGCLQKDKKPNYDIFVSKLSPDLSTLVASTFIGGSNSEGDRGSPDIILDSNGDIYLTCMTNSSDFPTITGAYDEDFKGNGDIIVCKISNDLSTLIASTLIGTLGIEQVNSIALDQMGNVFIAGYTRHPGFPTTDGAYQRTYNGTGAMVWGGEVFISKFNSDLTDLVASTYLGGSDWDEGGYLAIGDGGEVYLVGSTRSGIAGSAVPFPTTTGAYSEVHGGGSYGGDAFISVLSNDLTTLISSTYLGGNSNDWGYGIALDDLGNVFVTGHTPSENFPYTTGAYDEDYNSIYGSEVGNDMYVSKFSPDLSTLIASTFLGTERHDISLEIKIGPDENIYIGGHTNTTLFTNLATPGCYDNDFNGGEFEFGGDVIIASFNSDLSDLLSATYLGGNGQEDVSSIAFDADGNVIIGGYTNSADFPVSMGVCQDEYKGGSIDTWGGDIFVSIIPRGYYTDIDDDGVADLGDNCPDDANSGQEDLDEDDRGDLCDGCPEDYNPGGEDIDIDGIEDACDNCPDHPNPGQEDSNGNDVGDLCDYVCGDIDGTPGINILDIVFLINNVYKAGPDPDPLESADVNHDYLVNILDIVLLINNVYKSGPEPECVVWI